MIMEITIIAGVGSCVKRRMRWVWHVWEVRNSHKILVGRGYSAHMGVYGMMILKRSLEKYVWSAWIGFVCLSTRSIVGLL
jgi:hypothetical protein